MSAVEPTAEELRAALRTLTPAALRSLAPYSDGAVSQAVIAARMDAEAVRSERAAEGYISRSWYRAAAAARDRADKLRAQAKALRALARWADPR
jgi:hypothetical protein